MRNSICLSFGARRLDRWLTAVVVVLLAAAVPLSLSAQANPELLVSGLSGTGGSALGPSGDLYVTDGINGTVSRIDPDTGVVTLFASGLPRRAIPVLGGATDIAFLGNMAFALVTVVNQEFGGPDVAGIYRLDGINASTLIADIGTFSRDHVPTGFPVDLETGVQFAIETYRGGFLVTDGHHNRVLRVTLDGEVTELMTFGNIVPTGLATSGNTIYLAQAGPTPHAAADGKIVMFEPNTAPGSETEIASGGPLMVDVEFGRGRSLFGLSQGVWNGAYPGSPASPGTGALLEVAWNGEFDEIASLDLAQPPTSLEVVGNTAYVVTLDDPFTPMPEGEIWVIDNITNSPFGFASHD